MNRSLTLWIAGFAAVAAGISAWILARPDSDPAIRGTPGTGDPAGSPPSSNAREAPSPFPSTPPTRGSGALLLRVECRGAAPPASVFILLRRSSEPSPAPEERKLGLDGSVRIEADPGSYTLSVASEGFREWRGAVGPGDFGGEIRAVLEALPSEGSALITLTDPDGSPLAGGAVLLVPRDGDRGTVPLSSAGLTGWRGDRIPAGDYGLLYKLPGLPEAIKAGTIVIRPGEESRDSLTLDLRRRGVRVTDAATGDGIPGALLYGTVEKEEPLGADPLTSDSAGNADLWIPGGRSFELFVEAPDCAWKLFRIDPAQREPGPLLLPVSRAKGIDLNLRSSSFPAPGSVRILVGGVAAKFRLPFPLRPDGGGRLHLALAPGDYRLRLEAEGFSPVEPALTPEDFLRGEKTVELEPR